MFFYMNNMFWYLFLENFVFFIYKKSIYIVISNETFFDLIHFSDKMMLKKLHTKETQKPYILDGTNQHRIETKHTCQKKVYCIYIDMSQNEVSCFGSKKGFSRGKKDTSF